MTIGLKGGLTSTGGIKGQITLFPEIEVLATVTYGEDITPMEHTTDLGTKCLVVALAADNEPTSITWNSTPMVKADGLTVSNDEAVIWYLVNPDIGTYDIVYNGSADRNVVVFNLSNVNTSSPIGNTVTGSTETVDLTSTAVGSCLVCAIAEVPGGPEQTPVSGVTPIHNQIGGANPRVYVAYRVEDTIGTYTLGVQESQSGYPIVGVEFKRA